MSRTAKFAFSPDVLVNYIKSVTTYPVTVTPWHPRGKRRSTRRCRVRTVNGIRWDGDLDGRQLRRWINGAEVSRPAAVRMFNKYHLSLVDYERWATENGMTPVLRDTTMEVTNG